MFEEQIQYMMYIEKARVNIGGEKRPSKSMRRKLRNWIREN